jgi:hypothetical protein
MKSLGLIWEGWPKGVGVGSQETCREVLSILRMMEKFLSYFGLRNFFYKFNAEVQMI